MRLGEVLRLRKEIVYPQDKPRGKAIFVGLEHLESGTGRRTGSLEVDLASLTGRKPRFHKGDIVYGYLRPYLNKVWVAEFEGLCSVDQYVYVVDDPRVDGEFVSWFMRSPHYLTRAPVFRGPGQLPRIRLEEVAAIELDLPDLGEQRRIVAAIRQQLSAVDKARASADAQLEIAKTLPFACLCSTFGDSARREWPRKRLADVCTLLPSKSIASDGEAVVQAITTACLDETGFRPEGIKWARMRATDATECVVRRGEILVARSNTPDLVGRACIFDGEPASVVASDLTMRIEAGLEMSPRFVAAFLSFLYASGYWREKAGGASGSMKKITRSQLENQLLPVPNIDSQVRIATHLVRALSEAGRIRQTAESQLRWIEATRVALLRRAFTYNS